MTAEAGDLTSSTSKLLSFIWAVHNWKVICRFLHSVCSSAIEVHESFTPYWLLMLYDDIIKLFTVSPKIAVKSSDKISESFVTFISDFEGSKESVREGSILYIGQRLRKYHQYHNLISPQLLVIHWGNEKPNFRLEVETWERNYQNRTGITLFEYRDYNSFLESFNFFISLKRIE